MPEVLAGHDTVLCSACLLGAACRYDGQGRRSEAVLRALEGKAVIPVCPEEAAGLGTPRPPVHFARGDGSGVFDGTAQLVDDQGRERTEAFRRGATLALDAARFHGATAAILKEGSPSCGCSRVHGPDGARPGRGATASLLAAQGIRVVSDEEIQEAGLISRSCRR